MALSKVATLFEDFKFAYDHDQLDKASSLLPQLKVNRTIKNTELKKKHKKPKVK